MLGKEFLPRPPGACRELSQILWPASSALGPVLGVPKRTRSPQCVHLLLSSSGTSAKIGAPIVEQVSEGEFAASAPAIRVVLAEDQTMVRSALISLIDLEDDLEVVGEAGQGDEAVTLVTKLRPDVAVLDVDLPGGDGITACAQIHEAVPECACLMLTALGKPGTLQRALRSHARGFIVKHAPAGELIDAIRAVAAGRRIVDPALAVAALEQERIPVTDRELQVLRLIAQGASVKEIALRLYLSDGTVRNYTSNLIAKCGVRNRVELIRIATDHGWI